MHTLTNCTITNVEKGPGGTSAHGAWQIHNIWINNGKQRYAYFEKDGFIPVVGTMLSTMEFDVEQKGQYTNYTIKEMVAVPTAPPVAPPVVQPMPAPAPTAQPVLVAQPVQPVPVVKPEPVPSRELMMCVAYAKDILVQGLAMSPPQPDTPLEALVFLAGEAGLALFDQLKASKRAAKVTESVPVPTLVKQSVNSDPAPPVTPPVAPPVLVDEDIPF